MRVLTHDGTLIVVGDLVFDMKGDEGIFTVDDIRPDGSIWGKGMITPHIKGKRNYLPSNTLRKVNGNEMICGGKQTTYNNLRKKTKTN